MVKIEEITNLKYMKKNKRIYIKQVKQALIIMNKEL